MEAIKRLQRLWIQANKADPRPPRAKKMVNKRSKWLAWAEKILNRRGLPTSLKTCAYGGKTHWVKEVHKIGGGYWFLSGGCSGCARHLFNDTGPGAKMPTENECALLDFPILTQEEPKVGKMFTV